LQLAYRLAAIAVVSGHVWLDNIHPQRSVPLLYIIGTADPVNPLEGGYAHLPWNPKSLKPSVKSTVEKWLKLNNCVARPETVFERDGVKCIRYLPEDKGCEVYNYEVEGLGHVWPGGVLELPAKIVGNASDKLNATDVIWDFFKEHTLP
jgi:polyhydroxybutyrate depolymerase